MGDDLSRRIDAVAQRSYETQRQAEYTFAKAMEARSSVLGGLFQVATEIERKNGATLGGHKFRFVGPDTKPKLDPAIDVFVARVFDASFEGCPGNSSFGLHFEIDHYQHVTACYLGAAALVDTRDHGTRSRRVWRKLHLAVDAETQEIIAVEESHHTRANVSRSSGPWGSWGGGRHSLYAASLRWRTSCLPGWNGTGHPRPRTRRTDPPA
jgi:hypothetical protein